MFTFLLLLGNHSRLEEKDVASIHERLDDLVEWYLKARLQSFENVSFDHYRMIDDTMYLLDIRGKTYLGVHGDYDGFWPEKFNRFRQWQKNLCTPFFQVICITIRPIVFKA